MKFTGGNPVVPPAADGPVPVMMSNRLTLARSGAIDSAPDQPQQPFYGTDYTKPLMFINDGQYYARTAAHRMNLTGDQWGVMNETGSYPGQPWLWLYQLWYHVPGWRNSTTLDLIAIYMTGLATLLLLFVPVHPGPARHPALDTGASPDLAVTLGRPAVGAGHDAAAADARRAERGQLKRVTPAPARVPLTRAA